MKTSYSYQKKREKEKDCNSFFCFFIFHPLIFSLQFFSLLWYSFLLTWKTTISLSLSSFCSSSSCFFRSVELKIILFNRSFDFARKIGVSQLVKILVDRTRFFFLEKKTVNFEVQIMNFSFVFVFLIVLIQCLIQYCD